MKIITASLKDIHEVVRLALLLWPDNKAEELVEEFHLILQNPNAAVFLAQVHDRIVGFSQCQLRTDYVEGTKTSPVGYLEGIFVEEEYRKKGIARALVKACENWAKEKGCLEFASDCEITNEESLLFHLKLGFIEANRIICFTKRI